VPEEQRSVGAAAAEVADTDFLDHHERIVPTWSETLARHASTPVGGPLGRHAAVGRHWFWSPLRLALAFALLALMFSWFGKASCIQQFTDDNGVTQLDWRANRPYVAMCYSDVVPLYSAEQLDKGGFPYKSYWYDDQGKPTQHIRYMEYPVLTGMFQWVNAKLAQGWAHFAQLGWLPTGITVAVYFDITAFWLALAWLVTVWAVARTARRRPWDAILVAVSPLVLVHAFTNFDTLATAFAATGMLAWARRKPALAGVLFGLGVAAKLYPLFLLGALLVLCIRAGKVKQWGIAAGTTALTWAVVNFPIYELFHEGWGEFFRRNTDRGADPDSLYNVIEYFTGWSGFDRPDLMPWEAPTILNAVSLVLFLVFCAAIAWVGLSAKRRPRFAQLAFLVVAAFLLTNKVWSPQYSLWLVPLAVLAIPRWKPLLAWMTIDALVWVPRMMFYLGEDHKGLPQDWFLGAVVLRDLAVVGLCVLIIREIYRPEHDPVRVSGDDDPAGGVLEDAPDVVRLDPSRRERREPAEITS
jgi:uncharacterized membrane protein